MPKISKIAFREITRAEFYEINKSTRGGGSGGGQSYIDFNTSDISGAEWQSFFAGAATPIPGDGWTFHVKSLGTAGPKRQKNIRLKKRATTRYAIREQKLPEFSQAGRRLYAWSPSETGFPSIPTNAKGADDIPPALIAGLRIFLLRDEQGGVWAGWLNKVPPGISDPRLLRIFNEHAGIIDIGGDYDVDPASPHWPFAQPSDGPLWDEGDVLPEADAEPNIGYSWQKIYKRNRAAAAEVRALYDACQITGKSYLFLKRNGEPYLEVHHLVPLGKGGADSPHNMVVVSAQAHKMLHHADVSPIDLTQIAGNTLGIAINGQPHTITWHPQHAARVLAHNQP